MSEYYGERPRKRQTDLLRAAPAFPQSAGPRHMKRDQAAALCGGTDAFLSAR